MVDRCCPGEWHHLPIGSKDCCGYSLLRPIDNLLQSSTNVKNLLYKSVLSTENLNPNQGSKSNDLKWHEYVSPKVSQVIEDNWETIKNFSIIKDETIRVMGMKFPKNGFI